jgi:tetratricopeptide (TPR) repeat protein
MGDLDKAESYARRAIQVDPHDAGGYARLAHILSAQERFGEAADQYLVAIQRDPRQLDAYTRWIRLHVDIERGPFRVYTDRLQEALAHIAAGPDAEKLWAHVILGLGYKAIEGASNRAIAHLEAANRIDPAYSALYRQLALAYEEHLDARRALQAWRRHLYASTARNADPAEVQAHIDRLLQTRIEQPVDGAHLSGTIQFVGTATAENFQFYKLEYRPTGSSDGWSIIGEPVYRTVEHGPLLNWKTKDIAPGKYWLRLVVVDLTGNYGPYDEIIIWINDRE